MKQTQIDTVIKKLIEKSIPFLIVDYRGFKAETIEYTNKKGKAASFDKMTLACETLGEESQQIPITRDLTEDEKRIGVANCKPHYKKGDRLLVILTSYANQYGRAEARALSVELIEP